MHFGAQPHLFEKAKKLRVHMTIPEKLLWEKLRDRKVFKEKWRRQHPIYRYILDFYCHQFRTGLEIDGSIHLGLKEYDAIRTEEINTFGINIIRFSNEQVLNNINWVTQQVTRLSNKD